MQIYLSQPQTYCSSGIIRYTHSSDFVCILFTKSYLAKHFSRRQHPSITILCLSFLIHAKRTARRSFLIRCAEISVTNFDCASQEVMSGGLARMHKESWNIVLNLQETIQYVFRFSAVLYICEFHSQKKFLFIFISYPTLCLNDHMLFCNFMNINAFFV